MLMGCSELKFIIIVNNLNRFIQLNGIRFTYSDYLLTHLMGLYKPRVRF